MMTSSECARWLLGHDHYCILTHRRPDGDTIGSAAGLCRALRSLGKTAFVLENSEVTDKYAHYLAGMTKSEAQESDTLVSVDVSSPGMLARGFEVYLGRIALRIDHHSIGSSFTELELVDPQAAACGEIIWDLMSEMGVTMDKAMAEAVYVAVSTDTGCFRFSNTTAHTFRTAAACAAAGGDIYPINQALFDTNSRAKLRLQGWIAENSQFLLDGKIAVCAIPRSVEQALGVREDDMESISGFPRSIEGVCMSALLRQTNDGMVKMSLRAIPGCDVAKICAAFGGGGHKAAAGATVNLGLEEAADAVRQAMLDAFGTK